MKHGLTFTRELAERRAMGWVCDERPNAAIHTLKHVFRWRSTKWWRSTQAIRCGKRTRVTSRDGNISSGGTIEDASGDKLATDWSSKEDWISKGKKFYAATKDKTNLLHSHLIV